MSKRQHERGFSLVELSIVLVIIGVLTGAITAGKELMHSANLKTAIKDIGSYQAAIRTFEAKFNALPGDMYNASQFFGCGFSCNGDGDGEIEPATTEGLRAWQHLGLSGMLPEIFSGILQVTIEEEDEQAFNWSDMFISTAYAGQEKHYVCHNGHTIHIAYPAVQAHLNHGDYLGHCDDDDEGDDDHEGDDDECDDDDECEDDHEGDHDECDDDEEGDDDCGDGDEHDGDDEGEGQGGGPLGECDTMPEEDGTFEVGFNLPSSKYQGAGFALDWKNDYACGKTGNHIVFAAPNGNWLNGSIVSPKDAWNLDMKMDDGNPVQGLVESASGVGDTGCLDVNEAYDLDVDEIRCQMHFGF